MRLLQCNNNGGLDLTEFFEDSIPEYAILSHRWEAEEVTFKDLMDGTSKSKAGYSKIQFCGEQAMRDSLQYFWVDTCCIDKANSTELAEAINSMFRWYQKAARCYAYLSDVSARKRKESDASTEYTWESAFRASKWFTRGWTLQELLAPTIVEFFSREGYLLGDKRSLKRHIQQITGIPILALEGAPLSQFGIDERLSWIEKRQTTRPEDMVYSLLGMFGMYLPLIYGEGKEHAFQRLKKEIENSSTARGRYTPPIATSKYTPELLRFDDRKVRQYPEYEYKSLPPGKKRIRLLKLYPGETSGTEIYCELMEVEYDKNWHIPTRIQEDQRGETWSSYRISLGDNEEDEGERSDLEMRYVVEPEETQADRMQRKKRQELRELKKAVAELEKDPNEEETRERNMLEARIQDWKHVSEKEEKYEALSWCSGDGVADYVVLIKCGRRKYRKRVQKELALALKYLRRPGQERSLWIDAICIDQNNANERNHQVQMMSRIYTRAQQVCIWLGEADADSEIAIKFIKDEMKELKNFDTMSSNEQYTRKWQALMSLMQRDWFFRRWAVQEVALASAAMVYCGPHSVPWKSFAVAVEFFTEVGVATHRLSEVMKRNEKLRHVSGWFEHVSQLGASFLVQATGRVFRTQRSLMQPGSGGLDDWDEGDAKYEDSDDEDRMRTRMREGLKLERLKETQTIDPLERRSLLSLEYLVSTMFMFPASEPRDVVYALLAIAKDASPFAPAPYGQEDQKLLLVMTHLNRFLAEKPFMVDYSRPYSDVSRDFVEFSIARMHKIDPHQALDILCRPWALEPPRGKSKWLKHPNYTPQQMMRQRKPGSWMKRETLIEENKDGFWAEKGREFKYRYIEGKSLKWIRDYRSTAEYRKLLLEKAVCIIPLCTHKDEAACSSSRWPEIQKKYFPLKPAIRDIGLPSWVSRATQAPFVLGRVPGMDVRKTIRANADPLVGSPLDGHRNYNASGSEKLDLTTLRFVKRLVMEHYSLYVKGFQLDTVVEVENPSQSGNIPQAWLELGNWSDLTQDPPDEFWRTIVADRGRDNRNPPYYYARACKEMVLRGGHIGGSINTEAVLNDEQNSIVAEFCRRVHSVIWNRCLFKTETNRLGLASKVNKVCILYGCTVPVILRETKKREKWVGGNGELIATAERDLEAEEDRVEILKACIRRAVSNRERKTKYRAKKKLYEKTGEWVEMLDARQAYLEEKRSKDAKLDKEKAVQEREAKAKEDQKVFRHVLANKIKEAKDEKRNAELRVRRADIDIYGAQKSLEDAEKSAKKAFQGNTNAANDTVAFLTKARAALDIAVATAQQAIRESEEVNAAADKTIAEVEEAALKAGENPTEDTAIPDDVAVPKDTAVFEPDKPEKDYWYEFKGECYLHGVMDGEAMREKFYKDLRDWTFELR